jgi:hypothetical protein
VSRTVKLGDDTTQVQVVRNLIGLTASDTMRRNFEAGWSQYSGRAGDRPSGGWSRSTDFHSVSKDLTKAAFSSALIFCMCSIVARKLDSSALTEVGASPAGVIAETRTSAASWS